MVAAVLTAFGITACSPDEYAGADPNGVPTMEGVNFEPSVDQETNTIVCNFEREGVYPIWNIDGTFYSTLPTMSWSNTEAGTHTVELRLGNRNGFSQGSIKKTFTFNNTQVDFTPIFKKLCNKEWRIDYDEVGHMGCGESGTDASGWWAAQPNDKKDWGVYDDRITFVNTEAKGGTYTYNPGPGGTVYVNKDCTFGHENYKDDGNDYTVAVDAQETTFRIEGGTWTDKNGETISCNYLTFPAGTLLPYIPNDDTYNSPRYRIEGLTNSRLALVCDNGSIAWRLVLTTRDEVKAFEGFVYDGPYNLWKPVDDNNDFTTHFWYAPGWNQIADPGFTHEGAEYTFTLPEATTDQWQAQCPIKPNNLALTTSTTYDFSCILNADNDIKGVTVKLTDVNSGDNYVFVERVDLEAGKDKCFYLSDVNNLSADAQCELFFDFGGNPANTTVSVRNIVVKDHANDDGTVLPSEDPVDPTPEAVMDWDVDASSNLWKAVEDGSAFISVTPWFANDGWGQIADPAWSHENGEWSLTIPEGMGGSQWQGQFPINTTLTASGSGKYNFYLVLEADSDCPGVTIKLTQTDEADGTKHDDNFFFADRHEVKADKAFIYKAEGVSLAKGTDAHALSLFFDFGGTPAGTNIKISKIYFEEAMSYDSPSNLWKSVDDGTNFISVTPWFADANWSQIADPAWSHAGDEWNIQLADATAAQWQAQFPINTTLSAAMADKYNFSCIVESDSDLPGVTIKLTETDDAQKHDDNFFFADRHDIKADVPFVYTVKGCQLPKNDAHALSLFFDFGGNPAGTTVKIRQIIFEKAN